MSMDSSQSGPAGNGAIGVLWDMDGVVVDTGDYHYRAWTQVLADYGISFSRDQFRATFGMNNAGAMNLMFGRPPTEQEIADLDVGKEELFRRMIHGDVRPLPGVVEWLSVLRSAGVRQAVASSAPPENITFFLDELGLNGLFDALTSGTGMPGKPAPDVFLTAAGAIGVPPERCVVIEDAIPGVEAARRAGMKCIAVTTTNPADLLSAADIVVPTLDHLQPDVVWKLLGKSFGATTTVC